MLLAPNCWRIRADGAVRLIGAERAVIRSGAKLAYDQVKEADLPPAFPDLAARIQAARRFWMSRAALAQAAGDEPPV